MQTPAQAYLPVIAQGRFRVAAASTKAVWQQKRFGPGSAAACPLAYSSCPGPGQTKTFAPEPGLCFGTCLPVSPGAIGLKALHQACQSLDAANRSAQGG